MEPDANQYHSVIFLAFYSRLWYIVRRHKACWCNEPAVCRLRLAHVRVLCLCFSMICKPAPCVQRGSAPAAASLAFILTAPLQCGILSARPNGIASEGNWSPMPCITARSFFLLSSLCCGRVNSQTPAGPMVNPS